MTPKVLLVTTVKNEGPNILEWVAHHMLCGFDRIQIYQNDSDDETSKHLRTLAGIGAIEYFRNHSNKSDWQNKAYRRASRSEAYQECDWCLALDGDEFFNGNIGKGTVQELISACDAADEILVNWRIYGSSSEQDLSDKLVTERFTMSERDDHILTKVCGFKSLFRTSAYKRPGIHRGKIPLGETTRVVNGSGMNDGTFERGHWRSKDPKGRLFAQINHYPVRDASSFLLKTQRGSASHPDRDVSLAYWNRFNINLDRDNSLANRRDAIWAKMVELDKQSEGRINLDRDNSLANRRDAIWAKMVELDKQSEGRLFFLRENSLRIWKGKLQNLLAAKEYRNLFDDIRNL